MVNKKGSGFGDIYIIFIFLFVIIMVAGLSLFIVNEFNTSWQSAISDEIGQESKQELNTYNSTMNNIMDGAIVFWFVILILGSWVTAFFLDNTPVFFVIFLLLSLLSFFVLVPFANIQSDLSESALAAGYDHLPMSMFINNNLIMFMLVYIVGVGFSLYAKTRVSG